MDVGGPFAGVVPLRRAVPAAAVARFQAQSENAWRGSGVDAVYAVRGFVVALGAECRRKQLSFALARYRGAGRAGRYLDRGVFLAVEAAPSAAGARSEPGRGIGTWTRLTSPGTRVATSAFAR